MKTTLNEWGWSRQGVEGFDAQVSMGGFTRPRLRIVFKAVDQCGLQSGLARGIQFFHYIGQEQDLVGGQADGGGDVAVAVRFTLAADLGIEPAGKQRGQVTGIAMAEEQLLRRYGARRIDI